MRWPPAAQSRFGRNVWLVARANVLAQALPLIAAPLLTRLYAPADFGALALFASWLGIALAVATGRFEWSVPNARRTPMAAAVLALGAGALVAAGAACAIVLTVAGVAGWLPAHDGSMVWMWWLFVPALIGSGLQQLLQAWHVRRGELASVGRAKIVQSGVNVCSTLLLAPVALPAHGAAGLAGGVLTGAWVGLRPLWREAPDLRQALRRTGLRRMAVAWRRFSGEAGWSTVVSMLNAASFAIVPLLLARHFGAAEVGYYALMQRVAIGPVGLVGAAVSQSFWAEAAQLVRSDRAALRRLYGRSTRRLVWLALPLAAAAAAGPLYIGLIFGDAWAQAGAVLAASVPMLVGQVVVSPLSHLVIHRRQHWQAAWDAVRIALLVVAVEVCGAAGASLAATVLALSLVMAGMYVVLLGLNLRALAGR